MYILAFSLDWFTTIPGILIVLGVVLLIVAVILFVTGNKKDNKGNKVNNQLDSQGVVNVIEPMQSVGVTPAVEPASVNPVVETVSGTPAIESVNVQEVVTPKFEEISMGTPGVDPINPVDSSVIGTNEVSEQVVSPVENVVEIPVPEVTLDQTMVSVYGGENPVDTVQAVASEDVKAPTIYGGNDPLEATQKLPKVEEHHEPYGGAMNDVKSFEPLSETVVEIPEVEPVVTAPIEIETPELEEKEVSFEIPVAPVEIPEASVEIPTVTLDTLPTSEEKPSVEEL